MGGKQLKINADRDVKLKKNAEINPLLDFTNEVYTCIVPNSIVSSMEIESIVGHI